MDYPSGYAVGCSGGHARENGPCRHDLKSGCLVEGKGSADAVTSAGPPDCANRAGPEAPRSRDAVIHAETSGCPRGCATAAPRLVDVGRGLVGCPC